MLVRESGVWQFDLKKYLVVRIVPAFFMSIFLFLNITFYCNVWYNKKSESDFTCEEILNTLKIWTSQVSKNRDLYPFINGPNSQTNSTLYADSIQITSLSLKVKWKQYKKKVKIKKLLYFKTKWKQSCDAVNMRTTRLFWVFKLSKMGLYKL